MKYVAYLAGAAVLAGLSVPAQATDTFGQFFQTNSKAKPFKYTNTDKTVMGVTKPGATLVTADKAGAAIVYHLNDTSYDAHLFVDLKSTKAMVNSGSNYTQAFSGTIKIVSDMPQGTKGWTNLLSVSFTDVELDANMGQTGFTLASLATSDFYSSDFIDFSKATAEDFSFSFSGFSGSKTSLIDTSWKMGHSGNTGKFSGTGTFAADLPAVPEASTWAMMVIGFGAAGAAMRSNRRKVAFAA